MLGVLTLAYTIGYIDRQVLNLLVQPIKADLALTDVQVSLLQGFAFTAGYLIFTPLFGRWVDLRSRRTTLAVATAVWSCFTALFGMVHTFPLLLAMRFGLGAAESGLTPASWSILADTFDKTRLARAFSVFLMAPYLGGGLALLLGGAVLSGMSRWDFSSVPWLAAMAPWQIVFLVVSVPGLIVSVLLMMLSEPSRQSRHSHEPIKLPLREVLSAMVRQKRFYGSFYAGMALVIIPLYAFPAWLPATLMRRFDLPIAQVGFTWGLITLAVGSAGMLSGPVFERWLVKRGFADAPLRLAIICALIMLPCCAVMMFARNPTVMLAAAGVAVFFNSAPMAVASSALQIFSPTAMRGMTAALYSVTVAIAGLGIAPTLVALLTDYLFRDESRAGDSLAIVCSITAAVGALLITRCIQPYQQRVIEPR